MPGISLYGPTAVATGLAAAIGGSVFGACLAWAIQAEGDSAMGGLAAAGLLVGTWLMGAMVSILTGPYQPATAGMAWLAISSARLLVLIVGAIALALTAPTMGLGLWLALLLGGLALVAADCSMAARSFRRHGDERVELSRGDVR